MTTPLSAQRLFDGVYEELFHEPPSGHFYQSTLAAWIRAGKPLAEGALRDFMMRRQRVQVHGRP